MRLGLRINLTIAIYIVCLFSCCFIARADEGEQTSGKHFSISTVDNRPLYIDKLAYSAFKEAGLHAEFAASSSLQQGYTQANNGDRDGAISSTPDMEKLYPNLVKIPAALENNNINVFTRKDFAVKADGWNSLSNLSVGILGDRVYIRNNIPNDTRITFKETTSQLMEGLIAHEYDAVVLSTREHEIFRLPEGIVRGATIETLPEYLYMNKRNGAYMPAITAALERMFSDGRAEKILNGDYLPEMYPKKTILHIISASTNVDREDVFYEKLREPFKNDDSIEWYTVELNSLRFFADTERLSYYAYLMRRDLTSRNLSAIVASGDTAQDFLNEYYNLFFQNVPVLFYGADEKRVSEYEKLSDNYTGIVERLSAYETFSAAKSIFPNTKKLFVLNDYTQAGRKYQAAMSEQLKPFSNSIDITYNEDVDRASLLMQLRALPKDSIVLVGSYLVDESGQYYSFGEMKKALEDNCPAPIFTIFSTEVPFNAIGGKCLDYEKYGGIIGDALMRVLNGEKASDIPIVSDTDEISRWVFNKDLLDLWGVQVSVLPPGAEIINSTPNVWVTNPAFAYTAAIMFIFFIVVIIGLFLFLGRYKKQNLELLETRKSLHTKEELLAKDVEIREVNERMKRLIISAPVSYMLVIDGKIIESNVRMKTDTGLDVGCDIARAFTESGEPDIITSIVFSEGFTANRITRMNFVDGSSHRCLLNAVKTEYERRAAIVIWSVDIENNELKADELRAAQESLQAIMDNLPIPVNITDIESLRTIYCNNSYLLLTERASIEEIPVFDSERLSQAISSNEINIAEMTEMFKNSTSPVAKEIELQTMSGAKIALRLITCPIEYNGKRSIMGIMVDLTQEREFKAMQQSLQAILDTLPQPIRITNSEKRTVTYVNNSCAKLFGYDSPKDMEGLRVSGMLPEFQSDGTMSSQIIDMVHNSGEPVLEEIEFMTADGKIIDARLLSYPIEYMGSRSAISMITDLAEELEQRRMRESLQNVLDALPIPVRIVDIEGKTLAYVNKSFVEMFEYESADEVIGNLFSTIVPVLQRDGIPTLKKLDQVVTAKEPLQMEIEYLSAKGKIIDSLLTTVIIDFRGKKASLGIIKDLSAEKEQKRMRQNLQTIMDTMPIPVNVVDAETGKFLYGNNSYLKMQELDSIDDIIWTSAAKTVAPNQEDGMAPEEIVQMLLASEEPVAKEMRLITAEGNTSDVRIHTRRIDYLGRSSIIGVMTDLSAEKEYKTMQMSLQAVLDLLPIPVIIYGIEYFSIIYANNRSADLFGEASPDSMTGKPLTKYMPDVQPDGRNTLELLRMLKLHSDPFSAEFECISAEGGVFDALFTTSVIDYKGKKSLLGIVVDLTAEKEYEKMLLNAAEKEKEANQLKSRFLVNMSHEIRTPMNAIIGLSEIELRKEIDKGSKDVYRKISTSARSLLQIINDILDLSKIEANKMELINESFDLEDAIDSSLLVAAPRVEEKNVEFTLNAAPDLPRYVVGDKARLWQILKNFLDNAAKFTEEGKIVLTVREETKKSDEDTIWIAFIVEDTGIGMDEAQLSSVFMPYEQFASEMHKKYSGTGLGMSIAKQLCEIMGGSLSIRSKLGVGTTINATLPFERSKDHEDELISARNPALSGMNVLAVDDDELSLEIMSKLLRSSNINCVTARSGVEAMRTVFKYRDMGLSFDAILLDYVMDGLDGIETAKQIQMSLSKAPKLLMVTAHQKNLISEDMNANKIDDIIEKPFMPSKFIGKLSEAIGLEQADDGNEETFTAFNNVNILICEDNLLNQEVAVGMFKYFGITPAVADNGKHGIEILQRNQWFDLIFMDLQMPVMDGYEATAIIRADKRFDNIPIISLSADVMTEVVDRCLAAGMNDHLAKPIDFEGLHNMMVKWLPEEKQSKAGRLKKPKVADSPLQEALERFQGDVKQYNKALRAFALDLPDEWPEFDESVRNYKQTLIDLHSMKGVSGNLGETDIQLSAVRFETSIREGKPDINLYNAYISACAAAKKRILENTVQTLETGLKEAGTALELSELLEAFEEALRDYDPVGSSEISETLMLKVWPVDEALLAHVCELAEAYDFDEALTVLEALRSGLNEKLNSDS